MKNALETLKESGLVVKRRTNNKPAIIGGTESTECGGITRVFTLLIFSCTFCVECFVSD
jgi:hypothetical protein